MAEIWVVAGCSWVRQGSGCKVSLTGLKPNLGHREESSSYSLVCRGQLGALPSLYEVTIGFLWLGFMGLIFRLLMLQEEQKK